MLNTATVCTLSDCTRDYEIGCAIHRLLTFSEVANRYEHRISDVSEVPSDCCKHLQPLSHMHMKLLQVGIYFSLVNCVAENGVSFAMYNSGQSLVRNLESCQTWLYHSSGVLP